MPRKKVVKADPLDPYVRVCGNCKHFVKDEDDDSLGECFLNPPTVFVDQGEIGCARPQVETTEHACRGFEQRLQS